MALRNAKLVFPLARMPAEIPHSSMLSIIYQVTRRCNFDCEFYRETMRTKDSSLDQIASIQRNLTGVLRVFLSGGEPLLRRDFALSTSSTITS